MCGLSLKTWPRLYFVLRCCDCENNLLWVNTIKVTSQWASWRLTSPATRLFVDHLLKLTLKKASKPRYWPFVRGIHKWPVMQKPLPFDDIIMRLIRPYNSCKLIVSGRSVRDFKNAIFNLVSLPGTFRYCYDNVLEWVSQNLINGMHY